MAYIGDVNVSSRLKNVQPERVAEPTCPNIIVGIGQRKVRSVVHDGFRTDPDQVPLNTRKQDNEHAVKGNKLTTWGIFMAGYAAKLLQSTGQGSIGRN